MGYIIGDPDHDELTGRVLAFPADPFAKPAFSWRDWAAGQVATWRERRARLALTLPSVDSKGADGNSSGDLGLHLNKVEQSEADTSVLTHFVADSMPTMDDGQNGLNRPVSVPRQGIADSGRDSCWTSPDTHVTTVSTAPQWATERDRAASTTMRELTPKLVADEDRGKGDSVNAAMHRIMYPPKGAA